jgi:hypothetical protein
VVIGVYAVTHAADFLPATSLAALSRTCKQLQEVAKTAAARIVAREDVFGPAVWRDIFGQASSIIQLSGLLREQADRFHHQVPQTRLIYHRKSQHPFALTPGAFKPLVQVSKDGALLLSGLGNLWHGQMCAIFGPSPTQQQRTRLGHMYAPPLATCIRGALSLRAQGVRVTVQFKLIGGSECIVGFSHNGADWGCGGDALTVRVSRTGQGRADVGPGRALWIRTQLYSTFLHFAGELDYDVPGAPPAMDSWEWLDIHVCGESATVRTLRTTQQDHRGIGLSGLRQAGARWEAAGAVTAERQPEYAAWAQRCGTVSAGLCSCSESAPVRRLHVGVAEATDQLEL